MKPNNEMVTEGMHDPGLVAGVDIGGTKTVVVLCDRRGEVIAEAAEPTPAREGGPAMAETARRLVDRLARDSGAGLAAVGAGVAGVVDPVSGRIVAASDSFTGWAGFPLGEWLAEALSVPVTVDNDVNAFLAGELALGAARGLRDVVGITLGTGVGGAIAIEGRVHGGPRGAAGEIGHTPGYSQDLCTCGQRGHLETVVSGRSIVSRYAARTGRVVASAKEVAGLAHEGDQAALEVFRQGGHALGLAVATATNLLDVEAVVVGGGVRAAWDLLEPGLDAALADNAPVSGYPVAVRPSQLRHCAVALGAAAATGSIEHQSSAPREAASL
jgi:glucokinase